MKRKRTTAKEAHRPHPDTRESQVPIAVLSPDPSVADSVIGPLRETSRRVDSITDAGEIRARAEEAAPVVVVVDLDLGPQAVELVRDLPAHVQIVLLTRLEHRQTAARLLRLGASGYIVRPPVPAEVLALVERAARDAAGTGRVPDDRTGRADRVRDADRRAVRTLASALRHRDGETSDHMERVGRCAKAVAEKLGWSDGDPEAFALAAQLHDLGKIGLPDSVLGKPDRLTSEEFRIAARHPEIGASILQAAIETEGSSPLLHTARTICLYHHERWDGGGYPDGLSGEAIPWEARVVAVADVYDALLQPRPYREPHPEPVALSYIRFQRGRRFDPRVVDAFFDVLPDLRPG